MSTRTAGGAESGVGAGASGLPRPDFGLLRRLDVLRRVYAWYLPGSVRGLERLPAGPALLVGNHSGGLASPETVLFVLSWHRASGWREPLRLLGHDVIFRLPLVRSLARRVGGVPAGHEVATRALAGGEKVLVFPGGDHEALRPWRDRDRICFGGRRGFVALALRAGVPVVPVVTAGAHDVFRVLVRGERLARWLRLDRLLRLHALPVALALPWGVMIGPLPFLPLPAPVQVEVQPPLWLEGDPDDPAALARGYARVTGLMQAALERLRAELEGRRRGGRQG